VKYPSEDTQDCGLVVKQLGGREQGVLPEAALGKADQNLHVEYPVLNCRQKNFPNYLEFPLPHSPLILNLRIKTEHRGPVSQLSGWQSLIG
jgi:hypothetical protein